MIMHAVPVMQTRRNFVAVRLSLVVFAATLSPSLALPQNSAPNVGNRPRWRASKLGMRTRTGNYTKGRPTS
jgi:hypothetical protein